MKKFSLDPSNSFKVIHTTSHSQLAEMVLDVNGSTGGPNNNHPNSDQWLYVVSGNGKAIINKKEVSIKAGDLLLIKAEENHEVINTGKGKLKTFNIYSPPEY